MSKLNLDSIENHDIVTVTNLPWGDDDTGKAHLQLMGRLEKAEDEGEQHYLRCPEFGGELNGVSFSDKDITEIEILPSGKIVIVLRNF